MQTPQMWRGFCIGSWKLEAGSPKYKKLPTNWKNKLILQHNRNCKNTLK